MYCMWPPGRGSGGKGSPFLCNFVTRAKPTIGDAPIQSGFPGFPACCASRGLAIYCFVASIVCRFLSCLVAAAAAARTHTYRD